MFPSASGPHSLSLIPDLGFGIGPADVIRFPGESVEAQKGLVICPGPSLLHSNPLLFPFPLQHEDPKPTVPTFTKSKMHEMIEDYTEYAKLEYLYLKS